MTDEHSDSHHGVLFNNNLPVWVMLTIIRQTKCQTIVRKAVKHFVLLSPAQACDLSSQKKYVKKKKSLNSDILFKLQPPAFRTACRLTSPMSDATLSNLFPHSLSGSLGWVPATVGESWCAKSRSKAPLNAREATRLSDVKMKYNNCHLHFVLRFFGSCWSQNLKYGLLHQISYHHLFLPFYPRPHLGFWTWMKYTLRALIFQYKIEFPGNVPDGCNWPRKKKKNGNNTFLIQFLYRLAQFYR